MTQNYKAANGKLVVKQLSNEQQFDNGLKVNEARGKKDIVKGEIVIPPSHKIVYYPLLAVLPLSLEGEMYDVIEKTDVILIQEGGEN